MDPASVGELRDAIVAALKTRRGIVSPSRFAVSHFREHVRGLIRLLEVPLKTLATPDA